MRAELVLDRCASPTVGRRRWGAYFVFGVVGYLAGLGLVSVLAARAELDTSARLTLALVPPTSLLVLVKLVDLAIGEERIVFYQQAIGAVGATALAALALGDDVGTAIDLATIGVGTFLVFGRVGCFRVACCHGRPARFGVRYRSEHADAGFPRHWVGHRIFPVQLVDSALSAVMVVAAVVAFAASASPGTAAAIFACGYGVGRFAIELARGDDTRPYAGGLSEAQWTAMATCALAAVFRPASWTIAAAAMVIVGGVTVAVARRRRGRFPRLWLTAGAHVAEVARRVDELARGEISSATTRAGLRLTAAPMPDGRLDVVASLEGSVLAAETANVLAAELGGSWVEREVVSGRTPGVVHILLRT